VYSVDRKQKIGYVHQFQVSYQWQFSRDWSLDVGYVGNRIAKSVNYLEYR